MKETNLDVVVGLVMGLVLLPVVLGIYLLNKLYGRIRGLKRNGRS